MSTPQDYCTTGQLHLMKGETSFSFDLVGRFGNLEYVANVVLTPRMDVFETILHVTIQNDHLFWNS